MILVLARKRLRLRNILPQSLSKIFILCPICNSTSTLNWMKIWHTWIYYLNILTIFINEVYIVSMPIDWLHRSNPNIIMILNTTMSGAKFKNTWLSLVDWETLSKFLVTERTWRMLFKCIVLWVKLETNLFLPVREIGKIWPLTIISFSEPP